MSRRRTLRCEDPACDWWVSVVLTEAQVEALYDAHQREKHIAVVVFPPESKLFAMPTVVEDKTINGAVKVTFYGQTRAAVMEEARAWLLQNSGGEA